MQHGVAERGRIGGDHIERNSRHRHHHHSDHHNPPVGSERAENFRRTWPVLARDELIRLLKRAPEAKQKRNNPAAEKQGDAPSPCRHFLRWKDRAKHHANETSDHDHYLLPAPLPASESCFAARHPNFSSTTLTHAPP